jgi:SOS-response transcriptional repressor LexA
MAGRVLSFLTPTGEHQKHPLLSNEEQRKFTFIKQSIKQGSSPSLRAIASELGFSSSRSGQRIVNALMRKKLVSCDERGMLTLLP